MLLSLADQLIKIMQKRKTSSITAIMAFLLLVCTVTTPMWAQDKKKDKSKGKSKEQTLTMSNAVDSFSYMVGISIGYSLKTQKIDSMNTALIAKGMEDVLKKDSVATVQAANMYINEYLTKLQEKSSAENLVNGKLFLAKNKTVAGVTETPSGLQIKVIQEGTGKSPLETDVVRCHYIGKLINGDVFDSSYERGQPAEFTLNGVISGWTEGLQLMKEGGKYELYIPSELAYGEQGAGQVIGPNETLIFEIELLEVIPSEETIPFDDEQGGN
jgi:FKBP-type peptidyl-prolyl cis-trans isomerase FklB